MFFGYTHCPDICNIVLANMASALRGAATAVRKDVRLRVHHAPTRSATRPTVVRGYLDRFDPAFEGLIAPIDDVARAARALLHQLREAGRRAPAAATRSTTAPTRRRSSTARPGCVWTDDTTVADLRADLARLSRG